eukprot:4354935-Prymnesium_polylepis.5
MAVQPYQKLEDHVLAVANHFLLSIIFIGLMLMKAFQDVEDQSASSVAFTANTIFGFDSSESIAIAILIFTCSMLLCLVGALVYAGVREGHAPTMRLRTTHQPPVLLLAKSEQFHLFLSHTWATAQGECDASQTTGTDFDQPTLIT